MRRPLKLVGRIKDTGNLNPGSALADEEAIETTASVAKLHLRCAGSALADEEAIETPADLLGLAINRDAGSALADEEAIETWAAASVTPAAWPGSALADEEAIETSIVRRRCRTNRFRQCLGR